MQGSKGLHNHGICKGLDMISLKSDFELEKFKIINFVNLNPEEIEMIRNWRNNENIRKMMLSDHIISPEEHSNFIDNLREDNKNFYWVVKTGEESIGTISLNKVDFKNKNAYLGIYANPDHKLPGAGNILIENLKKLAFSKANLHTLKLEVIDKNERAINFYKKSGFLDEGRLKEFIFKDDRWYDLIIMGVINKMGE